MEIKHHRIVKATLIACLAWPLIVLIPLHSFAANAQRLTNVVIVSIDALHPEALKLAKIPTLNRLMQTGAFTLNGRSTEPPKTLIAHTAMFTGLPPEANGKIDNDWVPGEPTVKQATFFDTAQCYGFKTGYFYSKEKLGYLVNRSVDVHEWSRDGAIDSTLAFLKSPGRHYTFLHVSGLDQVGPKSGWLSQEYLEELFFIDDYLSTLIDTVIGQQNYLLIVTSDHAGHGKIHGSDHAEDYRLPLIVYSDIVNVKRFQDISFSVIALKNMLEDLLE